MAVTAKEAFFLINNMEDLLNLSKEYTEIESLYQPIYLLSEQKLLGYEVYTKPKNGKNILELINQASKEKILPYFDIYCLFKGLSKARELGYFGECKLFFNLHPKTVLYLKELAPFFDLLLDFFNLHPSAIVFELTEHEQPLDFETYLDGISVLTSRAFEISLDDFGSGCLSFKAFFEVLPTYVKLDKYFVRDLPYSPCFKKFTQFLLGLAEDYRITIIAEGIEDSLILKEVLALNIKAGQGFFLGKPSETLLHLNNHYFQNERQISKSLFSANSIS
ncbi:MAG: EAL domain-containing protein [Caldimicrobium sp.]|nr:EAL domain-containing protein [Caldimicrobium sp.]MDW8183467.1 EAL domain-containing protein [Caldimicrobium sp.]